MSGTLALAASIAEMDRDALAALVRRRRPHAPASILDPIGLAAELLRSESIDRAVAPLDAPSLAALHRGVFEPDAHADLRAVGLVGLDEGSLAPLDEVTVAVRTTLERLGIDAGDLEAPLPAPTREAGDTASWYVAALTAVAIAAEVLRALRAQPARLNRTGAVAVVSIRGIADATGIEVDDAARSIQLLQGAGALVPDTAGALLVWSAGAEAWLAKPAPERWTVLAETAVRALPAQLRGMLGRYRLDEALEVLPGRFPLLPATTTAAATDFAAAARHLGLAVDGTLGGAARALLAGDRAAALAIAARDMPDPVPGVYIQPDLSVIVPGPLSAVDEAVLAEISAPEQVGIASTRRITEASVTATLESGLGESGVRDALARLSVTGTPQPLDYMLTSLASRIRNIVVHDHDGDEGRTRIEVARADLFETLTVDRALHHLQLSAGDASGELFSKLRAEHVFAALSDARYTASLDAERERPELPPAPLPASTELLPPELEHLVDRVHGAARSEPGTGDFTRRLELAIRDRSTVRITAAAQGRTHVFTLLPTSLDAGRLRATDAVAGVERTLPVSTITAVE
ncbi:MAG: helicase-associated domain-containing protein [Leucobacter sp.]